MTRIEITGDIATCQRLRRHVFIDEQGVSLADEVDGLDDQAIHLLAFVADEPVGTARLLIRQPVGKIGRVCVLRQARGAGLGAALILRALDVLRGVPGVHAACLGAQTQAVGFYEKLGFVVEGDEFLDAGIPHHHMRCTL